MEKLLSVKKGRNVGDDERSEKVERRKQVRDKDQKVEKR